MLPVFVYFISGFVAFWFGVSLCCNCNNNIQNLQLGIYCTQHDTICYRRGQTLQNVDISRNSNGYISVVREASQMVVHAGSPTSIVHADMTLTRFKVKVTGHLIFRKL